jgi:hypothetical protein
LGKSLDNDFVATSRKFFFQPAQQAPPIPETAATSNTGQVGVDHDPIHAVVIAVKGFFVPACERVCHKVCLRP